MSNQMELPDNILVAAQRLKAGHGINRPGDLSYKRRNPATEWVSFCWGAGLLAPKGYPQKRDEAIPNGGIFDICATSAAGCSTGVKPWQASHKNHDYGQAADFRANGQANSIVSDAFNAWTGPTGLGPSGYCWINGFTHYVRLELIGTSTQHIHCDAQHRAQTARERST